MPRLTSYVQRKLLAYCKVFQEKSIYFQEQIHTWTKNTQEPLYCVFPNARLGNGDLLSWGESRKLLLLHNNFTFTHSSDWRVQKRVELWGFCMNLLLLQPGCAAFMLLPAAVHSGKHSQSLVLSCEDFNPTFWVLFLTKLCKRVNLRL